MKKKLFLILLLSMFFPSVFSQAFDVQVEMQSLPSLEVESIRVFEELGQVVVVESRIINTGNTLLRIRPEAEILQNGETKKVFLAEKNVEWKDSKTVRAYFSKQDLSQGNASVTLTVYYTAPSVQNMGWKNKIKKTRATISQSAVQPLQDIVASSLTEFKGFAGNRVQGELSVQNKSFESQGVLIFADERQDLFESIELSLSGKSKKAVSASVLIPVDYTNAQIFVVSDTSLTSFSLPIEVEFTNSLPLPGFIQRFALLLYVFPRFYTN